MSDVNNAFNLNNFIRTSQYYATIPSDSNFYQETLKVLELFYHCDALFFARQTTIIKIFETTAASEPHSEEFATLSKTFVEDVLTSGFLRSEKIRFESWGEVTFTFFPITVFNRVESVLCIGFFGDIRLNKETLNILLAVSTLLGTFLEKQSTQKSFETLNKEHQTILNAAGDGIMGIDLQMNHTFVNPAAANILGFVPKEMLGKESHTLWHHKHPDGTPFAREECKIRRAFEKGVIYSSSDEFFVRKDGTVFPAEVTVAPIIEKGVKLGAVIVFKDITERKETEAALKILVEQYTDLYDNSPDMYLSCNPKNAEIETCNLTACKKLGYSRDEIVGHTIYTLYHPDCIEAVQKAFKQFQQEGEIHDCELQVKRKDGTKIDVILNATAERDDQGNILRSRSVWVDITTLKATELALQQAHDELEEKVELRTIELQKANAKLKQLDQLKSMFIASMSHELRTPLNSIIGFSTVLLNQMIGPMNDKQRDYLRRVKSSGEHLLALISDVIDISKIEAGVLASKFEPFGLKSLFDEAVDTITVQAEKKGMSVKYEIFEEIELYTDRRRLLQCLLNFLSNAVKFSECGEVSLIAERIDGDVKISVHDTGIGISKEDAPKLFEAFERLESRLKVKAGGSGLGLYLTKKITEDILHGKVGMESELGKGSTFWLTIPITAKPEAESGTE